MPPSPPIPPIGNEISTILRHDDKRNTYKIALVRAINDVALAYPDAASYGQDVAVPLRLLAWRWISYYWPFVAPNSPIWQGQVQRVGASISASSTPTDMSFRPALTELRALWESQFNSTRASDGFYLAHEMQAPHRASGYSAELRAAFKKATSAVTGAIQQPIRYAGPGNSTYSIFPKPQPYKKLLAAKSPALATELEGEVGVAGTVARGLVSVPGIEPNELCVVIRSDLWQLFVGLSLWVEALCLHEWAVFTFKSQKEKNQPLPVSSGQIYSLLTSQPDNRQPLSWERARVDLLILEGKIFTCPWTGREFRTDAVGTGAGRKVSYDLDHILPLAVYPTNELWNLVPVEPSFNRNVKKAKLPSAEMLELARPRLETTYYNYTSNKELDTALCEDATSRFISLAGFSSHLALGDSHNKASFAAAVTGATCDFIQQVSLARNVARF